MLWDHTGCELPGLAATPLPPITTCGIYPCWRALMRSDNCSVPQRGHLPQPTCPSAVKGTQAVSGLGYYEARGCGLASLGDLPGGGSAWAHGGGHSALADTECVSTPAAAGKLSWFCALTLARHDSSMGLFYIFCGNCYLPVVLIPSSLMSMTLDTFSQAYGSADGLSGSTCSYLCFSRSSLWDTLIANTFSSLWCGFLLSWWSFGE